MRCVSWYGYVTFCAVYFLAVATPGPGVAAVIARGLARGPQGAAAFIAGFLVGDLIWFLGAALGLSALAQTAHSVFVAVRGCVAMLEKRYSDSSTGNHANARRPSKAHALRCRRGQIGFPASLNSSRNRSIELMRIALTPQTPSRRAVLLKRPAGATQILKRRGHDLPRSPTVWAAPAHA